MGYWLLKSEPGCYSIADLKRDKRTMWDGVRNYQARNFLRDGMKKGDLCVFYHSGDTPPAAVGICEVKKEGYPDITQFDPHADHYDADSDTEHPRWFAVDVAYHSTFARPVTLPGMRANERLRGLKLLARGNRLSVLPMTKKEYDEILRMSGK